MHQQISSINKDTKIQLIYKSKSKAILLVIIIIRVDILNLIINNYRMYNIFVTYKKSPLLYSFKKIIN